MNIIKACRLYADLTQQTLAERVGIHYHLICNMEKAPPAPCGTACKLVADDLGLPYEAVLREAFTTIPDSFFDRWPQPEYKPAPTEAHKRIGGDGVALTTIDELVWGHEVDNDEQ